MKTGNTCRRPTRPRLHVGASMEPGHEDREYPRSNVKMEGGTRPQWSPVMKTGNTAFLERARALRASPQWSPVMKTGNTATTHDLNATAILASMEPGHEDREYPAPSQGGDTATRASMEPGHEDREYRSLASVPLATSVAHSCEDCHSAPPADGRERRQGRQEPALTRARALSGDPIGTRALARQSGILSWGAACGVRRT